MPGSTCNCQASLESSFFRPSGADAGYIYSYDADGMRMEKAAGSSGTMYWAGPSGTLTETDLTGAINEEYIYFNGERVARVDRPSGTVHYYFSNNLGSASVIASSSGAPQAQYFYYPYGGLQSSTGSDTNHYKFTGKERDAESSLDYFSARYYASTMGRFMQPDLDSDVDDPGPIPYAEFRDPQTLNLYSYVRNNPLNRIDPDGHKMTCTTDANGNMKCTVTEDQQPPDYIGFRTLFSLLFVQPVEALYRSVNPPNCPRCLSADWAFGNVRPLMPRPAGRPAIVPKNWIEKSTRKGNGKIYIDPQNEHNRVRVMDDGYMKVQKNGQFLDVNGSVIPGPDAGDTTAAHIPVNSTMQSPFEDVTVVEPPEIEMPPIE